MDKWVKKYTIIKYIDCPNCGSKCLCKCNIQSEHEYRYCDSCGYEKSTRDNKETLDPYGAYDMTLIDDEHQFGSITDKILEELKELFETTQQDHFIKSIFISRYVNGKIIKYDFIRQIKLKKLKEKMNG
jgi:transcription elongation factor Elf1